MVVGEIASFVGGPFFGLAISGVPTFIEDAVGYHFETIPEGFMATNRRIYGGAKNAINYLDNQAFGIAEDIASVIIAVSYTHLTLPTNREV